jgi:peptidoglycan/LPS O-acetylase OafA/YrhL
MPRIAYVDGVRAIAVLAVVACHAGWAVALSMHWPAGSALEFGQHGVDLFFVVSGFCLAFPVLHRRRLLGQAQLDVAGYATRRLLRIVPPYYLAIFALLCGDALSRHLGGPNLVHDVGPVDLLRQLCFLDAGTKNLSTSFWTLPIEMRWYVFFPPLLLLWMRRPRAFVALGCALVLAYQCTLFGGVDAVTLPGFMLGIVAADWAVRGDAPRPWAPLLGLCGAVAGTALEALPASRLVQLPAAFGGVSHLSLAWQLAAFGFIVSAGQYAPLRRCLSAPWLTFVGTASYAIYLIHQPIANALVRVLPMSNSFPADALAVAALSALGGVAFHFAGERPFLNAAWRRRSSAKLEPVVAAALQRLGLSREGETRNAARAAAASEMPAA